MRHNRTLWVLSLFALTACSSGGDSLFQPTPADFAGSWSQVFGTAVAGSSFTMNLRDSAAALVGTGTFAGEAGPFGTLELNGSSRGDSLHLRVVYTLAPIFPNLPPDTAQLDGALTTSRDRIDAVIVRRGGVPQHVELGRAGTNSR